MPPDRRGRVLETDRLNLRELTQDDAEFIVAQLNDPDFIRNVVDRGVRTIEAARAYIADVPMASYHRHGFGLRLVELKGAHTPIGICGLIKRDALDDVDIGFAFLPPYRAQGFALEAATAKAASGVLLEFPRTGGHVGFRGAWLARRLIEFFRT